MVAELVHFHQSVSMGDQQMPVVMGELDSPAGGGLEVQSLQGGEGVIDILVDQQFVAFFIADGQVLVRERCYGVGVGLNACYCLVSPIELVEDSSSVALADNQPHVVISDLNRVARKRSKLLGCQFLKTFW